MNRRKPQPEPASPPKETPTSSTARNREIAGSIEMEILGGTTDAKGLRCRECGCSDFRTINTRLTAGGVLRRRLCRHCGRRMSTREEYLAD
jgi:hypothetical protein